MLPPNRDLARRRPVWAAWSELYLDTEPTAATLDAVARALAASPYAVAELAAILLDEVHPCLVINLLVPAGVWSGFDAAQLEARILRRARARWRWPSTAWPLRRTMRRLSDPLLARVARLRAP